MSPLTLISLSKIADFTEKGCDFPDYLDFFFATCVDLSDLSKNESKHEKADLAYGRFDFFDPTQPLVDFWITSIPFLRL